MEALLHQVFAGLASGAVYASLALALVMIYRVTHFVNFAQGELALCSTYVAWAMIERRRAVLARVRRDARACRSRWGSFVERVVIRPAMRAPALSVVIVFIGLMVILNSVAGWVFGYTTRAFPSPFPTEPLFGNHYLGSHELGVIGVTLAMLAVLYAFFRFTSLGLALRAVADNPESSRLVGIRVERMLALGWGLSAVVGAIAGMMIAPIVFLDPSMMAGVMLYAFAAALLGGIDSPGGAVVGGFTVGILENLVGTYVVGTELKLTTALALIVGVLDLPSCGAVRAALGGEGLTWTRAPSRPATRVQRARAALAARSRARASSLGQLVSPLPAHARRHLRDRAARAQSPDRVRGSDLARARRLLRHRRVHDGHPRASTERPLLAHASVRGGRVPGRRLPVRAPCRSPRRAPPRPRHVRARRGLPADPQEPRHRAPHRAAFRASRSTRSRRPSVCRSPPTSGSTASRSRRRWCSSWPRAT